MPLDERVAAALSRPYAAGSLAGRGTADILAWMGPGRTWAELRAKHLSAPQFPLACWTLPPAAAALTFARANRRLSDEVASPLAVPAMAEPQQGLAVVESWCSAHGPADGCSRGVTALRLDGDDSYLIKAASWRTIDWSHTGLDPGYHRTIAFIPLSAPVARQALAVARLLAAITEPLHRGTNRGSSSEARSGALWLDGVMSLGGTLAHSAPAACSSGDLDEEARFNLVVLWLGRAITGHLLAEAGQPSEESDDDRQHAARTVLTRWRAGGVPDAAAIIAAELLVDADAADVAQLLGELPPTAPQPLRAARECSLRHQALAADPARLLAAAGEPGVERQWAIGLLAQRDPAAAQRCIADAAAHEIDPAHVAGWTAWGKGIARPRVPPAAAVLQPSRALRPRSPVAPTALATPDDRSTSARTLAEGLADHRLAIEPLLMAAWAYDLRELRPQLMTLANAGPDDQEGPRVELSGGAATPQCARYHLARQILSLWDEPDAATRARLLCAFALQRGIEPSGDAPQVQHLRREFAACGAQRGAARDVLGAWTGEVPTGLAEALR